MAGISYTTTIDLVAALVELKNCAAVIDNKHHAHIAISDAEWSDLHAAINAAHVAIADAQAS